MIMNWDNIKYLFQLPLEWFKAIHNKVFKAYGTNFIVVRDGDDGAMHIDVDENTFSQQVLDITGGGSGGGTVKSVDGIAPNADGNVPLGAIRSINDNFYPDENGNVEVGLGVASVNGEMPDANGNVEIDVGTVNSVNGATPDANGNVTIEVGTVRSVNGVVPVGGNVSLGTIIHSVDNVSTQDFGNLHLNAVRSVNGLTTDFEHDYNVNVGTVKSVNSTTPDDDGNVNIDVVTENQLTTILNNYVLTSTLDSVLEQYVTETALTTTLTDYALTSDLTSYAKTSDLEDYALTATLVDYALTSDLTSYVTEAELDSTLTSYVQFNELANQLTAYVTYTGLDTILLDYVSDDELTTTLTSYVKNADLTSYAQKTDLTSYAQKTDLTGYVTIDTDQIITGSKTFGSTFQSGLFISQLTSGSNVIRSGQPLYIMAGENNNPIYLQVKNTDNQIYVSDGFAAVKGYTTAALRSANGVVNIEAKTLIDIISLSSSVDIAGKTAVNINAPANEAKLINAPTVATTDTTSKAIATCGWASSNFIAKNGTLASSKWVKTDANGKLITTDDTPIALNPTSTGFLYGNNGTLSYINYGTAANTVAQGNHTHNTSQLNNDAGFVTTAGVNSIIDEKDFATETYVDNALTGYVTLNTPQSIPSAKTFGSNWYDGITVNGELADTNTIRSGKRLLIFTHRNDPILMQVKDGNNQLYLTDSTASLRGTNAVGIVSPSGPVTIEASRSSAATVKGNSVHIASINASGSDVGVVDLTTGQVKMQYASYGGYVLGTNTTIQLGKGTGAYIVASDENILLGDGAAPIILKARENETALQNPPTVGATEVDSPAVATCGWTASKFVRKPTSTVTADKYVITNVSWNGTQLTYSGETWKFDNGVLKSVVADTTQHVIDTPVAY